MTIDTVTLFFALLAVALQLGIALTLLSFLIPSARIALMDAIAPIALLMAAAIAVVSMLGSLYLSEVAKFTPCKLCWYQRTAMYPSAILLVIAAFRGDGTVRRYVLPLVGLGAIISSYHILLERFPNLESGTCDPTNPCSLIWFEKFGFVTIPVMALTAFLAIAGLLSIRRLSSGPTNQQKVVSP